MNLDDAIALSDVNWVFGYGSLIWRPGFEFATAEKVVLDGLHRSLCIYSHRYRGTPQKPGLVFGLEPDGVCHGTAFEVDSKNWATVCAYLWEREQVTGVYVPVVKSLKFEDGREAKGLTFMADVSHSQYVGGLSFLDQAHLVKHAHGERGSNIDYVLKTMEQLEALDIADEDLNAICQLLL